MKNVMTQQNSKALHFKRSQVTVFVSFIKFESLVASSDLLTKKSVDNTEQ